MMNLRLFDDDEVVSEEPAATTYKIVENTFVCVNGAVTELRRNMQLVKGKNGAVVGVECEGSTLDSVSADVVAALLKSGAIVEIETGE